MKTYFSDNDALTELLIDNGIELTCNENMEVLISDEDADRIEEIVKELAPAAIGDYCIEDITED